MSILERDQMRVKTAGTVLAVLMLLLSMAVLPSIAFAAEPGGAVGEGSSDGSAEDPASDRADYSIADPASDPAGNLVNDPADTSSVGFAMDALDEQAQASLAAVPASELASLMGGGASEPLPESVVYRTYVENVGWQDWVQDGEVAGTSGQALRLEALEFALEGSYDGEVFCQAHIENIGWQRLEGTSAGDGPAMAGTSGRALRMEAIRLTLAGAVSSWYDIVYRAHVQNIGWQDWVQNGELAGTSGQALRIEALQVKLVSKSAAIAESDGGPGLVYNTHVQNVGWQSQKASGEMAGTSGQSLRMEAATIWLDNAALAGSLEYRAHVQNIGWQDWVQSGEMAGTSGQSLRMEALQIALAGNIASRYDVVYRAHVQNVGWQPWVSGGALAGTTGLGLQVEALRVSLVAKGTLAISEGAYLISDAHDVGVIASSPSDAELTTSSDCVGQQQKYYFREESPGVYSIQSVGDGRFLADTDSTVSQQSYASDSGDQLWNVIWDDGAILKNQATGRALALATGSVTVVAADPANPRQHLAISDVQLIQDGTYQIMRASSNSVLDVHGASWRAGANVMICTPNGGGNQAFAIALSDAGNDVYVITCAMTGKTLDVENGSSANGANVRQWMNNGSNAQRWRAFLDRDGAIEFVNVSSGRHLAAVGEESGANVVSSDEAPESNRKWILVPTSYVPDRVLIRAIELADGEGSYTDYLILVDLTNNRTVVFEWSLGSWEPIHNWICSTGAPWSPTVLGDYEVTGKGFSFNGSLGGEPYTCYYYTQFCGDYLFHSVPYHQGTWNVQDNTLGESVSHGCVRLATENAKWIYDNIPYYTHVLTYY